MPNGDAIGREQNDQNQCRQRHQAIRENHGQLSIPAVHQGTRERTQKDGWKRAGEGGGQQGQRRTSFLGEIPNQRELYQSTSQQRKHLTNAHR